MEELHVCYETSPITLAREWFVVGYWKCKDNTKW